MVYNFPTKYTINVTNNNPVPAFSSILIIFPSTVNVMESQVSCMVGTNSVPCVYNVSTNSVSISSITAVMIAAGALPAISVSNVFNP